MVGGSFPARIAFHYCDGPTDWRGAVGFEVVGLAPGRMRAISAGFVAVEVPSGELAVVASPTVELIRACHRSPGALRVARVLEEGARRRHACVRTVATVDDAAEVMRCTST